MLIFQVICLLPLLLSVNHFTIVVALLPLIYVVSVITIGIIWGVIKYRQMDKD